jgi:hypothetical protein
MMLQKPFNVQRGQLRVVAIASGVAASPLSAERKQVFASQQSGKLAPQLQVAKTRDH